jgi:hypothetical protein
MQGKQLTELCEESKLGTSLTPKSTSAESKSNSCEEGYSIKEDARIKKLEIFLQNLEAAKERTSVGEKQLCLRKKDLNFFYDKQILKMEKMYEILSQFIQDHKI